MERVGHDAAVVRGVAAAGVGEDCLVCDQTLASALLSSEQTVREGGEEWIEVVAYWWLRFLPWWWGLCGCCGRVFGGHSWEGSC